MQETVTGTGTVAQTNFIGSSTAQASQRVVPLLQSLSRTEELVAALAMRLDPVTNHTPTATDKAALNSPTVTGRINQLGDTLQYLLDNIEL
jgi:hypothetical protein